MVTSNDIQSYSSRRKRKLLMPPCSAIVCLVCLVLQIVAIISPKWAYFKSNNSASKFFAEDPHGNLVLEDQKITDGETNVTLEAGYIGLWVVCVTVSIGQPADHVICEGEEELNHYVHYTAPQNRHIAGIFAIINAALLVTILLSTTLQVRQLRQILTKHNPVNANPDSLPNGKQDLNFEPHHECPIVNNASATKEKPPIDGAQNGGNYCNLVTTVLFKTVSSVIAVTCALITAIIFSISPANENYSVPRAWGFGLQLVVIIMGIFLLIAIVAEFVISRKLHNHPPKPDAQSTPTVDGIISYLPSSGQAPYRVGYATSLNNNIYVKRNSNGSLGSVEQNRLYANQQNLATDGLNLYSGHQIHLNPAYIDDDEVSLKKLENDRFSRVYNNRQYYSEPMNPDNLCKAGSINSAYSETSSCKNENHFYQNPSFRY